MIPVKAGEREMGCRSMCMCIGVSQASGDVQGGGRRGRYGGCSSCCHVSTRRAGAPLAAARWSNDGRPMTVASAGRN